MGDFGCSEKLGGPVGALGDACTAFDAFRGVHRALLDDLWHRNHVRFRRAAGVDGDEAAGLNDSVERAAIDDEVFDHRKCARAPRLDPDLIAVFEVAHVELTGRRSAERSVRDAVDHHPASAADALAAIVLEVNRILPFLDQLLVDDVEHFEERGIRTDVHRRVFDETAFGGGRLLAPDVEGEVHDSFAVSQSRSCAVSQ